MNNFLQNIAVNHPQLVYEIKSASHTFIAILIGSLLASSVINSLLGTDLPTIQQFTDVYPVLVDSIYRALWLTLLTQLGLANRNVKTSS